MALSNHLVPWRIPNGIPESLLAPLLEPTVKPAYLATMLLLTVATAASDSLAPRTAPPDSTDDTTNAAACDRDPACALRAKVDRHLLLMGEVDNDRAQQASLRELIAAGPAVLRAVHDAYNAWTRDRGKNPNAPARPGEMRWRATYLIGALGFADGRRLLYDIARREDPDPRHDPIAYADDQRVKLRAVAGLEQLKGIEELKDLHQRGGTLANATTAALYELGVDVGGVRRVDARTALAAEKADITDFHPSKGRPAQPTKPGAAGYQPKPRPDTPVLRREE